MNAETSFGPLYAVNESAMGVSPMDAAPGSERRRWPRLPLAIPVFVRGTDERGKEFLEFTSAMNICPGGALVATRRYFPIQAQVFLEIPSGPIPGPQKPAPPARTMLEGRVVRVINAERHYLCGVEFAPQLPA